jgi:hypothetical protein
VNVPVRVTLEIDPTVHELLAVLTRSECGPENVEGVILKLIDHAQQGVYRPGAWEREWLCEAFGHTWTKNLEWGDPYGRTNCEHIFQRPKP